MSMRFYNVNDKSYISVTTLLDQTKDKTFLNEWKARVGEEEAQRITTHAANTGTKLHKKVEQYLKNENDVQPNFIKIFY